ncbi:MAG: MFS transporter [Oligoflexia bacterium]|nr:MFS transporter [Oligoflexia bacterium]
MTRAPAQLRLMFERRFFPLFWTQFFGAFNDNFLKNALVLLITFKAARVFGLGSVALVAAAGAIFISPFFLFSATAGQLADKYDKTKIIHGVKLAEILIMLLAGYGFFALRYELLLVALFCMGVHSTFFGPVKYSILPQLLGPEDLMAGNGLIEAGTFLAILLGTITGGIFVAWGDAGVSWISRGLLSFAALGYGASRLIPSTPPADPSLEPEWNPVAPTFRILRDALSNRKIIRSILLISWFWFFGAVLLALLPAFCRDFLKTDAKRVTLFLTTFSIGIGVGSILCSALSRYWKENYLVSAGAIGMSLFCADLFLSGVHQGRIFFDLALLSISGGVFIVPLYTRMQTHSEPSHLSRIVAANNILNALFMVLSAFFVIGLKRIGLTIPETFLALGVINGVGIAFTFG